MKSSKSSKKDIFLGSFIIMIFLIFGTIIEDPLLIFYNTKIEDLIFSLPDFIVLVPFIGIIAINIYFAIIANTKNRKILFKSAIITTCLSLSSYIIALLTPSDSNPLLLLFIPIAIVFYPFGAVFEASFSGIKYYFWDYAEDWLIYLVVLVTTFMIPLVTYFLVKTHCKKKYKQVNTDNNINLTKND